MGSHRVLLNVGSLCYLNYFKCSKYISNLNPRRTFFWLKVKSTISSVMHELSGRVTHRFQFVIAANLDNLSRLSCQRQQDSHNQHRKGVVDYRPLINQA